ncbi:SLAP domain-containing protein [Lactobacillus sp. LL6]|uniref:SLAP domain-containing protein n=1 Tax=Lactobacillus sp. LL6 TaxID=2596827 RepID=UPI00118703B2|nr:SLAP domain-containing protein [Lactobacillus sp. LL6]TSO26304.1 s-layer protein [Lactobacillus sp. LL6]
MKLNKKLTAISAVALMGIAPFASKTVQAADVSITKTTMHNSAVYDKNGKNTGKTYSSYQKITVDPDTVEINGSQYYKLTGKNQYIKATNIDGVKRTVEHNAYVYATSTRRANSKLVKKGTTIVTYGGSYKFKNGKRYYRVGGPAKQYVKVANLGDVVKDKDTNSTTNTAQEETTITVSYPYNVNIYDGKGNVVQKKVKLGTKFITDRREITSFVNQFPAGMTKDGLYRIKGTDHWILAADVKAERKLPLHDYNTEHYSYINFIKDTDVYDAKGNILDPNGNGQRITKQLGDIKVNKLLYIWLPKKNKAELFYHLVGKSFYATKGEWSAITVKDGYVKADDVKYSMGIKLTPSNTPEEAKSAYEANQATSAVVNSNN